jgi:hypothetical protein
VLPNRAPGLSSIHYHDHNSHQAIEAPGPSSLFCPEKAPGRPKLFLLTLAGQK